MKPIGTNYYLWPARSERRKSITRLRSNRRSGLAALFAAIFTSGCASVFDAPPEPTYSIRRVDFNNWKPADIQPCVVARDGVAWKMVDEVRNCRGWIPI